ncbi:MAG: succinate dehydrogenase / fumarate reductase flavoprotein subunit [Rickettsiales bacterium]
MTIYSQINHNFQTIIIGAGGAGMMAALSCANEGIKNVAVISKVFPTMSHTVAAKGGINAALGNVAEDNWQWHCFDTIKGADYLADHDSVELMCKSAPQTIIELENMGVVFSRNEEGKIDQRIYGGQKTGFGKGDLAHRACFSKDSTGHTILNTLYQQCLRKGIKFFSEFFVTDLLMSEANEDPRNVGRHACGEKTKSKANEDRRYAERQAHGAIAIDLSTGQINIFNSKITILATGGYGQIYQNSTSSDICTGDGNAFILREGLQLQDMEFVQFHPTSLHGTGLLISEAARGEGGYLINNIGERFMKEYAPNYQDLASRDVIARAIATEIHEGRGGGVNNDQIYLVISHLGEQKIKEKIPTVLEITRSFSKIDPLKEPIPIANAAHYTMGGIPANANCEVLFGDEKVSGLLAIGEAASNSVHGANRLGCNSLLDILVFGNLSGKTAAKLLEEGILESKNQEEIDRKLKRIDRILSQKGDESAYIIKQDLKKISEKFIGVFRNSELLEEGLRSLIELKEKLKSVEIKNKNLIFNDEIIEFFQTENLLIQAIATAYSALKRIESRGAHFREDFPNRDDENWLSHSRVSFDVESNEFNFKIQKVRTKPIGNDQIIISPEKRSY